MATETTTIKETWQQKFKSMLNKRDKKNLKDKVCDTFGVSTSAFYYWVNGTNKCPYNSIINNIFGIEPDDENNNTITK